MKVDLSILFNKPDKDKKALLNIEPLAPLSIVSTLPGSYYKSLDKPTKANLCGVFENIMGWHIGEKERRGIKKKLEKVFKKNFSIEELNFETSPVGYTSLLGHLFEIEIPLIPHIKMRYDDVWKQQLFRDGYSHPKGTPNLSYNLIAQKEKLERKDGKITNDAITAFHKENKGDYPMYYTSPRKREYIILEGNYQYKLAMNSMFFDALKDKIEENNIAYLGTNEGWVNLKIEAL